MYICKAVKVSTVEDDFREYLLQHLSTVKRKYPYLLNNDNTVIKMEKKFSEGGRSIIYDFQDKDYVLKFSKEKEKEEVTTNFQEVFPTQNNKSIPDWIKIQNLVAKTGHAPAIIGSGYYKGHKVSVIEKVLDSQKIDDVYDKKDAYILARNLLKSKNICHDDLNGYDTVKKWNKGNIIYGKLKGKKNWYLLDFDQSWFTNEKTDKMCKDKLKTYSYPIKETEHEEYLERILYNASPEEIRKIKKILA